MTNICLCHLNKYPQQVHMSYHFKQNRWIGISNRTKEKTITVNFYLARFKTSATSLNLNTETTGPKIFIKKIKIKYRCSK